MRRCVRARGDADPATVWERYAQVQDWPRWAPHLRGVRCTQNRLTPGAEGVVLGPGPLKAAFVVLDVRAREHTWTWRVTLLSLTLRLEHRLTPGPGGGTTAGLVLDGPAPVVLGYAPVARWALRRLIHP